MSGNYPAGVTDNDPYFNDDPEGEYQEQPCGLCGDTGEVKASREMALDAGDPELEGQNIACWVCAERENDGD